MRAKLQLNRKMVRFDDFHETGQHLAEGTPLMKKLNIILFLYCRCDRGISRKEFAAMHGISPRTLNRWINKFNLWGLPGLLESSRKRPGPKPKVTRKEFNEHILPEAEQLTEAATEAVTVKALFRSAQKLGLFPWSYSTFRRRIGALPRKYRKPRIEPSFEEMMLRVRTGCWPRRLKAFARKRSRQEKLALERFRHEHQKSKATPSQ